MSTLFGVANQNLTLLGLKGSSVLDQIGNVQGDVLYRGASGWSALPPGTSGYVLATQGAGANPHWVTATAGNVPAVSAGTAGQLLTNDGSGNLWSSTLAGNLTVSGTGTSTFAGTSVFSNLYSSDTIYQGVTTNGGTFVRLGQGLSTILIGASYGGANFANVYNDTTGVIVDMVKTRGAAAADYAAVQNGDILGILNWRAGNGSSLSDVASITCYVDGVPSGANVPSRLVFQTRPNTGGFATALTLYGNLGATFAGNITVTGQVIHATTATPANSSATGTTGTIAWDSSYIYVCTAPNTWKRAALSTW